MAISNKKPFVLAILDGWGFGKREVGNPIKQARTPMMDGITQQYPMVLLQASGQAVGMTWGESGNSEVGHLTIGAGRIVEQYLSRINRSIADKTFFSNPALSGAFTHAQKSPDPRLKSGSRILDFALGEIGKIRNWKLEINYGLLCSKITDCFS